jgi:spermidine synthase
MNRATGRTLFLLFFVSGFCGLLYQIVWTRLAFASFGIIAPVLSIVLSIFMLGLGAGAWLGGSAIGPLQERTRLSPILFYAMTELVIGVGAFAVPRLFQLSEEFLLSAGEMDSTRYLFFSAVALALSILPWCLCMGATFPFMMAFVRSRNRQREDSFSFLYFANVLGAMSGTALTAFVLIEMLGFRHTLFVAGCANFLVALISCGLARTQTWPTEPHVSQTESEVTPAEPAESSSSSPIMTKLILFSTGFCAMAMEVVWVRSFTPVLQAQVYAFAATLVSYLGATFAGSVLYRRDLRRDRVHTLVSLLAAAAISAFLPIVLNESRLLWNVLHNYFLRSFILMLSIFPLCAVLGYLTPSLIDNSARGEPRAAGRIYAVNVLGCIIGPLCASYLLLPSLGERYSLVLLALPFLFFYLLLGKTLPFRYHLVIDATAVALVIWSTFFVVDFAAFSSRKARVQIRRDYAASVLAVDDGRKNLLVNGVGMTALVPATKFMAHLPLMLHTGKPQSALIICFGMGTSFRSALSWGIDTTAVELVPGVRDSFGFFHADADRIRHNPQARIIIDDGRRYLKRTREQYDIIVVDPPPPISAAGSSLLYSEEFYHAARRNLKPYGILQAWLPATDRASEQAVVRSVRNSFPHVQSFRSPGDVGIHILASMEPINVFGADSLAVGMPITAGADLMEWTSGVNLPAYIAFIMSRPVSIDELLNPDPDVRITDDRPYNEYFLLRRLGLF